MRRVHDGTTNHVVRCSGSGHKPTHNIHGQEYCREIIEISKANNEERYD